MNFTCDFNWLVDQERSETLAPRSDETKELNSIVAVCDTIATGTQGTDKIYGQIHNNASFVPLLYLLQTSEVLSPIESL